MMIKKERESNHISFSIKFSEILIKKNFVYHLIFHIIKCMLIVSVTQKRTVQIITCMIHTHDTRDNKYN